MKLNCLNNAFTKSSEEFKKSYQKEDKGNEQVIPKFKIDITNRNSRKTSIALFVNLVSL